MQLKMNAILVAIAPIVLAGAVHAQTQTDAAAGDSASMMELPAACKSDNGATMGDMPEGDMAMGDMKDLEGHRAMMMQGMMAMQKPMMTGMMNEDPDLAFACGMIPHHQGAIVMSEAELKYGDNDEMRALAQEIIAAQKREIERLTTWIEARGK